MGTDNSPSESCQWADRADALRVPRFGRESKGPDGEETMGCCHYSRAPAQTDDETLTLACSECEEQVVRCAGCGQPARWPVQQRIRALNAAEAHRWDLDIAASWFERARVSSYAR